MRKKNLYDENLKDILKKEKNKFIFKLPLKLDIILTPIIKLRMISKIRKCFYKHGLDKKIKYSNFTLEELIRLSFFLFKDTLVFKNSYSKLFDYISSKEFSKFLKIYDDNFVGRFLKEINDNILDYNRSEDIIDRIKKMVNISINSPAKETYIFIKKFLDNINIDNNKKKEINECLAVIEEKLLNYPEFLNKYLELFENITKNSNINILLKFFITLKNLSYNIGSRDVFKIFLDLCNKFYKRDSFEKILEFVNHTSQHQDLKIFQLPFEWAVSTNIPLNCIERALEYGNEILEKGETTSYGLHPFERFFKYLKDKENALNQMKEDDIIYYIRGAKEFLIE